jgi:hypothetical protein
LFYLFNNMNIVISTAKGTEITIPEYIKIQLRKGIKKFAIFDVIKYDKIKNKDNNWPDDLVKEFEKLFFKIIKEENYKIDMEYLTYPSTYLVSKNNSLIIT